MVPLVGGQAVSLFGDYIAFFSLPYFVLALTAGLLPTTISSIGWRPTPTLSA